MVSFTNLGAVAASIGMLAFRAAATELTAEVLARGADDNSTLVSREPTADCRNAQYMWADVDCYYDFDQGGNFLNYVVRIEPTGQSNTDSGWCKGIFANIYGECGRNPDGSDTGGANNKWSSCNDYLEYVLHNPVTREHYHAKGIDLNFHYAWPWEAGEDATKCITSGIKKGICTEQAEVISFKNGGCYKR